MCSVGNRMRAAESVQLSQTSVLKRLMGFTLDASTLAGVLKEEERLAGLFTEHVTGPAAQAAEPAQSSYGAHPIDMYFCRCANMPSCAVQHYTLPSCASFGIWHACCDGTTFHHEPPQDLWASTDKTAATAARQIRRPPMVRHPFTALPGVVVGL